MSDTVYLDELSPLETVEVVVTSSNHEEDESGIAFCREYVPLETNEIVFSGENIEQITQSVEAGKTMSPKKVKLVSSNKSASGKTSLPLPRASVPKGISKTEVSFSERATVSSIEEASENAPKITEVKEPNKKDLNKPKVAKPRKRKISANQEDILNGGWSCELCGRVLSGREEWSAHARAHLEAQGPPAPPYQPPPYPAPDRHYCLMCRQDFADRTEFMFHLRAHFKSQEGGVDQAPTGLCT